jgi:hypothetical protein
MHGQHHQREFDFPRAEKLALLERLALPAPPKAETGPNTTRGAMAAVLKAIDCKARNNPVFTITWDELAQITQLGKQTVKRAARGLVALDLLILHARRAYGWHAYGMQIVWSNLQDHRAEENPSIDPFFCQPDRVPTKGDRVPTKRDRVPTVGTPRNRPPTPIQRSADSDPPNDRPTTDRTDDRAEAEKLARKVGRAIGTREPEDVDLAAKIGWLATAGTIAPAAVYEAIEALTIFEPRNRPAYFQTCINNHLAPAGETLNELLATIPGDTGHRHRQ